MNNGKLMLAQWGSAPERAAQMRRELNSITEQLDEVRELNGVNMDGMPHGTSVGDPTAEKAMSALKLQETYNAVLNAYLEEYERLMRVKCEVDAILDLFPPLYRDVARLRYMKGLAWESVAYKLNISTDYAKHINSILVRKLET